MNCYRAPDDKLPKQKVIHPPKVNGDELCDGCDHQRRKHIFDRSCGEYPCACVTFIPSERFYDWKNQLVPDVRMGEKASENLRRIQQSRFKLTAEEYNRLRYGAWSSDFTVGITGTEDGMSPRQDVSVRWLLSVLQPVYLRHGDCIGVDRQVACIADELGIKTISHPPIIDDFRAKHNSTIICEPKDFLERDDDIASSSSVLIACPKESREVMRSGTWATVRYARKYNTPRIIILP